MPKLKVSTPHMVGGKKLQLTCENFVVGEEQCGLEPNSVKQAKEVETSSWACKMNHTK